MISRAPFCATPAEARQSVYILTLMASGVAAPLSPPPPGLRRGPLRPLFTRSWVSCDGSNGDRVDQPTKYEVVR